MVKEYSAGGIVYKNSKKGIYWLVAQHSHHKGWVFPKGLIGDHRKGESSRETALREVLEETGIKAKIVAKIPKSVTYFYTWQGEKRFKTVTYYLMEYIGGDISDHDWEMSQVVWLTESETEKKLSFKSDKEAFQYARQLFKQNSI